MKKLTEKEIKFIKDTGWTPTVYQMNYNEAELKHTKFAGLSREEGAKAFHAEMENYDINISELYKKFVEDCDGISLEYEATYLFYTFFTKEELENLTDEEATKWLKDFQYYFGYRKWDGGNLTYVNEAIEIYKGERIFYLEDDGSVWNTLKDEIKNNPYFEDKVFLEE